LIAAVFRTSLDSGAHSGEPMSNDQNWKAFSDRLTAVLKPTAPPIAISFLSKGQPAPVARLSDAYAEPNAQGRTGQVPAGCVFWMKGAEQSFATTAADHANCSVGSFTHGFLTLQEAAAKDDVCAVLESGWVDAAAMQALPHVGEKPETVVYSPLAQATSAPDVVLLRINGLGLMAMQDALPELRIEGKPQCHIIAMAKEQGQVAASVGCALSRARTGMRPEEMTCAIPGRRLEEVTEAVERAVALDRMMASYAAADAKRFQ
jgi:uncharacterized protein (DUF169 family)